jgi:hypothetical protein
MSDLYMNGRGVMDRTRKLNDALWDAMVPAWLGTSAAICGPFVAVMILLIDDEPRSILPYVAGAVLSLACFALGAFFAAPWFKARAAVQAHRKAMEAETTKRGRGWAHS